MKVFKDFPTERPVTRFLDNIESPEDLKKLTIDELEVLADELREYLLIQLDKQVDILVLDLEQ